MPSPWAKLLASAVPALGQLSQPQYQEEAARQDLDPANRQELEASIRDPRHQDPVQQQALMSERDRIKGMQLQQLQQQVQMFPQRLSSQLDLQTHTGMPSPSPESQMAKILAMMARRHGMPRSQVGAEPQLMMQAQE